MPDSPVIQSSIPNGNHYGYYFTAVLAFAMAVGGWVMGKQSTDVVQTEAIHDLEKLADTFHEKTADRFTRGDGDKMRERLIEMNNRLICVEVKLEMEEEIGE